MKLTELLNLINILGKYKPLNDCVLADSIATNV